MWKLKLVKACQHVWTQWTVVEKTETLKGPLGVTQSTVWFNERRCTACGWTELKRIEK